MIDLVHRHILPAAYDLLPGRMCTPRATAMLLAIGLQESKFLHRQQVNGPARGFWQFEAGGGVTGVLTHPETADQARQVLLRLRYPASLSPGAVHGLLANNDVLAAAFARLLLWTVAGALPLPTQASAGWRQYMEGWRPGKPHPETWTAYFTSAWQRVHDESRFAPAIPAAPPLEG